MHVVIRGLFALFVVAISFSSSAKTQTSSRHCREVSDIVNILLSHSLTHDIDAKGCHTSSSITPHTGHKSLRQKIISLTKDSKPLTLTLVGFPFKSGNTQQNVLGLLPDQGERVALEKLHSLVTAIDKVYKPGAKLSIYTDGLAFYQILGISLKSVLAYEQALKKLASDLPGLSIITLSDLLPAHTFAHIDRVISSQAPGKLLSPTQLSVLKKRLLYELDYPKGKKLLTVTSLEKIAQDMHTRSQQINAFYKKVIPKSVSLSVHYQEDIGKKIGLSLVSGDLTPWHGVAVLKNDGSFEIRRKSEVEETHTLTLHHINGIACYFYSY